MLITYNSPRVSTTNNMWRSRIFWRLFGAYSILLTVSFGLLGWLLVDRMENHLLQEIQHGLEIKTLLIRDLVNRQDSGRGPRCAPRQFSRIL